MSQKVNPIPDGHHTLTPKLTVDGAAEAIEFYKRAFGATELHARITGPDGKVGHAELVVGDSPFTINDEHPDMDILGPKTRGGSATTLVLHVEDVDRVVDAAVANGAKLIIPVADQFYGHRSGRIQDPFGHLWIVSTQKEELTPEEVAERAKAFYEQS